MMWVLLKVKTPLSTTVNVSNQSLMLIYQKLRQTYKYRKKSIAKDKNLKDMFYLIFLTRTLNLRHFQKKHN
jgi:hypothetical protein